MKIRKGDNVIVTTGKDKGKKAKILKVFPKDSLVLVEGLNLKKKHQKAKTSNQKGQIIDMSMPMHISNVSLLDGGKRTRAGFKIAGEKKVRVAKKTGKEI